MKEKTAKFIRVISVPPVMISLLVWLIAAKDHDVFRGPGEILGTLLFLGLLPMAAYLPFFSGTGEEKRENQRKNAFRFTLVGYTAMVVWVNAIFASAKLMIIAHTYFFSILLLTLFNRVMKIRASGHACSITGPILLTAYLVNWQWCIPWCLLAGGVAWSSLLLGRHTKAQLATGALVCCIAFGMALVAWG